MASMCSALLSLPRSGPILAGPLAAAANRWQSVDPKSGSDSVRNGKRLAFWVARDWRPAQTDQLRAAQTFGIRRGDMLAADLEYLGAKARSLIRGST